MITSSSFKYWPWYFFTAAMESLVALVVLILIPSEGGFSIARWSMIGVLVFLVSLGILFGFRPPHTLQRYINNAYIISVALAALACGALLFFLRYLYPEHLLPVYIRLAPLLYFLLVLGIETALFILFLKNGFGRQGLQTRKPVYTRALIVFSFLLGLLIFVSSTRLGITADPAYWGEPGVALLGWQAAGAILLGFAVLLIAIVKSDLRSLRALDILTPLLIWLVAIFVWLSVPPNVLQNSFYAPITPPSFTPYPYSDAGFYDSLAQSILIGTDYLHSIPPRPMYVVFLTVLHFLFGQDYLRIIAAQTVLLAFFPVVLYFLGKKIHSPAAGVTVAFLAIFRELTTLWISSNTRVSNSKMLTVDLPTALAIACLCLVVMIWLERRDFFSTILVGGSFGLLLLLRTQSVMILPILVLISWFVFTRQPNLRNGSEKATSHRSTSPSPRLRWASERSWLAVAAIFLGAMVLTSTPWLIHNYRATGKLAFDDPNQLGILFSQYSFTGNLEFSRFDLQSDNLVKSVLLFTLHNPLYVAGFVANHFLNTEIGGLLTLPLIERYNGIFEPVNLYWLTWDGTITWYNLFMVILYLFLIAIGLSTAWQRWRWIGWIPLAINIGYALSNGISRFSSWRYNLPVDWVAYFYLGIGAMEVLGGFALLFGAKLERVFPASKFKGLTNHRSLGNLQLSAAFVMAGFIFAGSLPWLVEGITGTRFTASRHELVQQIGQTSPDKDEIESFLLAPGSVIEEGILLYPRFYRRDLGLASVHPWPAYAIRDYPRLGFVLLNDRNIQAIFPTKEPFDFPHGSDVIALGCPRADYLEVRMLFIPSLNKSYISNPISNPCN